MLDNTQAKIEQDKRWLAECAIGGRLNFTRRFAIKQQHNKRVLDYIDRYIKGRGAWESGPAHFHLSDYYTTRNARGYWIASAYRSFNEHGYGATPRAAYRHAMQRARWASMSYAKQCDILARHGVPAGILGEIPLDGSWDSLACLATAL